MPRRKSTFSKKVTSNRGLTRRRPLVMTPCRSKPRATWFQTPSPTALRPSGSSGSARVWSPATSGVVIPSTPGPISEPPISIAAGTIVTTADLAAIRVHRTRSGRRAVFRRGAVPRRADNSKQFGIWRRSRSRSHALDPGETGAGRREPASRARSCRPGEDGQALVPTIRKDRRMSDSRTKRRRPSSRAYRPALDGKLEDRVLLSQTLHQYLGTNLALLKAKKAGVAFHVNVPPFALNAPRWNRHFRVIHAAAVQTIRGGQAANVVAVDGSHFRIQLGYISNTIATSAGDGAAGTYTASSGAAALATDQPTELPQPIGTVRVYAMPNGEVGIIVDGSNDNTALTINPLPTAIRKGYAHSYAYGASGKTHILNIGQITVNSGSIGAIEGFHTANLVGPLVVNGTDTVDRIAFNAIMFQPAIMPLPAGFILPEPSITVGGTLNTLDVLQGITLNTGTNSNITIGRDLNLLNVGQDITLENGSFIKIDRHLGAIIQPPKGTGTGSNVLSINLPATTTLVATPPETPVSGYIQGNVKIVSPSTFQV